MNTFLSQLIFAFIISPFSNVEIASASEKRTDGKPGSEFADFQSLEGELSAGAHFGALLSMRSKDDGNFLLGADLDYRPFALFGMRLTYLQGIQSPRASIISLAPLAHTKISNFHPYILGGPGIAFVNRPESKAKFLISGGLGADIELLGHFLLGMTWMFHSIIDSADAHSISARVGYQF